MQAGLRADLWAKDFRELISDFSRASPGGIDLEISFDQSSYVEERLGDVMQNLIIGVCLVVSVLLFALGWRAAFVVAVILPLSGLLSIFVLEKL